MPDLSTVTGRLALVTPFALKYGLEPSLVAAVCEQESNWEPGAARFEPAFLRRYVEPLKLDFLESLDRATSWGLMQVMGQVAKEMGLFAEPSMLRIPEAGVEWGCKKLQRCFLNHGGNREAALLAYNGGSNNSYPAQVIARIAKYTNV